MFSKADNVVLNIKDLLKVFFFCKTGVISGKGERGCEAFPEWINFQVTVEDRE